MSNYLHTLCNETQPCFHSSNFRTDILFKYFFFDRKYTYIFPISRNKTGLVFCCRLYEKKIKCSVFQCNGWYIYCLFYRLSQMNISFTVLKNKTNTRSMLVLYIFFKGRTLISWFLFPIGKAAVVVFIIWNK